MSPKEQDAMVTLYSTNSQTISTVDSNTSSLQEENEALRRQLLEAQELLIKRNVQLATLEGEIQSLTNEEPRSGHGKEIVVLDMSPVGQESAPSATDVTVKSDDATAPSQPGGSILSSYDTPAFGILVQQQREVMSVSVDTEFTPPTFANDWTAKHSDPMSAVSYHSPPRMIKETIPVRSFGVDESLFQVEMEECRDDVEQDDDDELADSITTMTIDTDLTSTPSMYDLVPKIASIKPIPLVSPSHTKETESLSSDDDSERSFWNESMTFDTVTPSMSASNHKHHTVPSMSDSEHESVPVASPSNNATTTRDLYYANDNAAEQQYSSMASSTIYTTADRHSFSKPPLPPRTNRSQRVLPREVELERTTKEQTTTTTTIQVANYTLVDADHDKGVYTGSMLTSTNLPHGKGVMRYDEHRQYDGDWVHGRWHGQGHLKSRVFDYHGAFRNDQKHGRGVLVDVKANNGNDVYEGMFYHDKKHGQGKLVYRDASTYFGQFQKGMKSGYGLELRADGSTEHEGMFLNDEPIRGYDKKRLEKLRLTSTMIEI